MKLTQKGKCLLLKKTNKILGKNKNQLDRRKNQRRKANNDDMYAG